MNSEKIKQIRYEAMQQLIADNDGMSIQNNKTISEVVQREPAVYLQYTHNLLTQKEN
jgi:hypothetical protein